MVETCAELDQRCYRSADLNLAGAREVDAGDYFQKRTFARTIPADNSYHFSRIYVARDVLESFKIMKVALVTVDLGKDLPKRIWTLPDYAKALRHIFNRND